MERILARKESTLTYAYAFLALMTAVIIRELGHAFAMKSHKIAIKRFGIGWPIIPFALTIKVRNFAPVSIHPLLIGAYVEPESGDDITSLHSRCQDKISAAGVFWNLTTAAALFVALGLLHGKLMWPAIVAVTAISVLYLKERLMLDSLLPSLGIAAIASLVIYSLNTVPTGDTGNAAIVGPIGIVDVLGSLRMSFFDMLFAISLMFGITNMLPIPPLDGGRVLLTFLKRIGAPKMVAQSVSIVGMIFILGVLFFTTTGDISRLFSR